MAHGSEVQHPPVETGFIIPLSWGVCGGVGAQVLLLTPLNVTWNTKMPFCLDVFTKAGICSPALGLGMSCPPAPRCAQHPAVLPVPSHPCPCGHHIYRQGLAQPQSPSFCLALPFASPLPAPHQFTPVCTSPPPCLLSASPTAPAQLCWEPAVGAAGMGVSISWRGTGGGSVASVSPGSSWADGRDPLSLTESGGGTLIPSWCDPKFKPRQLSRGKGGPCLAQGCRALQRTVTLGGVAAELQQCAAPLHGGKMGK